MQPIPNNPAEEEREKTPAELDYDEGLELLKRGSFPQAAAAFHNALRGFEEEKNDTGIARSTTKLAEICLEREEYGKALPHLQRALAICRTAEDDLSATYLQKRLLRTHRGLKDYPAALELALELMAAYQDYNNPAGAVEMMEQMAEIYLAIGEREKAAESYRTAAAIHQGFKHTRAAQAMLDLAEAALRS
ncbi:MAG: tetratricopeptide repeat protein [Desulfurivibrio sp.]